MEQNKIIVLIGFAEALSAPEVVWSLADQGFLVYAFTRKGKCSALCHSRYVKLFEISAPEEDFETAIKDLNELLKSIDKTNKKGQGVFLPLDDTAIWIGSRLTTDCGWILAGPIGDHAALALR